MAKFTLKTALIKVTDEEGNSFKVRGLSPNDIAQLLMIHQPMMEQVFDKLAANDPENMNFEDIAETSAGMIVGVVEQAPAFAAHLIALAADDQESFDDYLRLPVGVQVDAIFEIGRLTLETVGDPKKLLGLVKGLLVAKAGSNRSA